MGEERRRKKSGVTGSRTAADAALAATGTRGDEGYETDAANPKSSRSKSKLRKKRAPTSDGYETDDGYISSATTKSTKKKGFFRLGNKSKSSIPLDEPVPVPEPPPPPPVFRLPIAARFARTLNQDELTPGVALDPPLAPPVAPFSVASPVTSTPTSSVTLPPLRDFDRDSIEAPESTTTHETYSQKRSQRADASRFGSGDSSDHYGSSSGGHSIFSKVTNGNSSASSAGSHAQHLRKPGPPMISLSVTRSPSPPSSSTVPAPAGSSENRPMMHLQLPNQDETARIPTPSYSPFLPDPAKVAANPQPPPAPAPAPETSPPSLQRRAGWIFGLPKLQTPANTKPNVHSYDTPVQHTPVAPSPAPSTPIEPSTSYLVLTPSPLPSPRAPFAQHGHDLPPPSPPPTGPLPDVPPSASTFALQQRQSIPISPSKLRPESPLPSRGPSPQPKRGVESPFPARPLLPSSNSNSAAGGATSSFESRMRIPRYRELYALPLPESAVDPSLGRRSPNHLPLPSPTGRPSTSPKVSSEDDGSSTWDAAEEELQHVLARFQRHEEEKQRVFGGANARPLSRHASLELDFTRRRGSGVLHTANANASRSRVAFADDIDVISNGPGEIYVEIDDGASERSFYPDEDQTAGRKTMYLFDHPNGSQPSLRAPSHVPSFYSDGSGLGEEQRERRSFMDNEKSEQARQRFLQNVGDMYDKNGRELDAPPVPKLTPPRSTARLGPQQRQAEWF